MESIRARKVEEHVSGNNHFTVSSLVAAWEHALSSISMVGRWACLFVLWCMIFSRGFGHVKCQKVRIRRQNKQF